MPLAAKSIRNIIPRTPALVKSFESFSHGLDMTQSFTRSVTVVASYGSWIRPLTCGQTSFLVQATPASRVASLQRAETSQHRSCFEGFVPMRHIARLSSRTLTLSQNNSCCEVSITLLHSLYNSCSEALLFTMPRDGIDQGGLFANLLSIL